MRVWLRIGLVAGTCAAACGESVCDIDASLAAVLPTDAATTCGSLGNPQPDPTPWTTAHDCVIGKLAAQETFWVRWNRQGIEGAAEYAFAGTAGAAGWELRYFERAAPRDDGKPRPLRTYRCEAIVDLGACADVQADLCLRCDGMQLVDTCD